MRRKHHIDATGTLLLIIISLIFGLNQTLTKIVNGGLQPVYQAGLRSAIGLVLIYSYALVVKKPLDLVNGSFWPDMLAGLFFSAEFVLLFQSLEYTTVSRASIFFYTMPFWAALGAHFLIPGERLSGRKLVGLTLAIIGIALALYDNRFPATERAIIGDLFCLLGAICWAGIVMVARTTRLSLSCPEMQLIYQLCVSAIVLLAIAPYFGEPIRQLDNMIVAIFLVQTMVVVGFGFLTWFWLLSVYPASDMTSFSFLTPIFGVMFGWLVFEERLNQSIFISLALVCIGVYLVNKRPGLSRSV